MASEPALRWDFDAIGTSWRVCIFQSVDEATASRIRSSVDARIELFDHTYSRFRTDSLVTTISKRAGTYQFPDDARHLFAVYRSAYEATDGQVTPLIGQMLSDAGYDAAYSLKPGTVSQPPTWDGAMEFIGDTLHTYKPVLLDFGAAGKGCLVDIVAELLRGEGIKQFYINAGGDIRAEGLYETPLKVGLEHPHDQQKVIGTVTLTGGALCGSSGNRRRWAEYTHIINPRTLSSETTIEAVWCMATDAMTADMLTTMLYFVKPSDLTTFGQFDWCILYTDGTVACTPVFQDGLFT